MFFNQSARKQLWNDLFRNLEYMKSDRKKGWEDAELDLSELEEDASEIFTIVGKRAAINATNENKALGIPITFLRDNQVVTVHPSGETTVESELAQTPTRKYKKGTVLHVRKKED